MIAIESIIGHIRRLHPLKNATNNLHLLLEWAYALLILAPWGQNNESEWILNNLANEVFTKDSWKLLKQYCRIHYELKYLRGSAHFLSSLLGILENYTDEPHSKGTNTALCLPSRMNQYNLIYQASCKSMCIKEIADGVHWLWRNNLEAKTRKLIGTKLTFARIEARIHSVDLMYFL